MGCQSDVLLGSNLVFSVVTHDPDTSNEADADYLPTYDIYHGADVPALLSGSMTKKAGETGEYLQLIACTTANGFVANEPYTIFIKASINGNIGGISYGFRVQQDPLASAVPDGYPVGSAGYVLGNLTGSTLTVISPISGSELTLYRGTTWSITMTVGNLTGISKLWFTAKHDINDPDSAAIVQIEQTAGLLVLNGSSNVTPTDGSIVINVPATGNITVTLKPNSSSQVAPIPNANWDVKALFATTVALMADGRSQFTVLGDVTRHVS